MKTSIKQFTDNLGNTIAIDGTFPIHVKKSGDYWIAHTPHFKTFGYSKIDENQAETDLRLALDTFFDVHIERGTLEKALLLFGWKKANNVFAKPKFFNIPEHKIQRELVLA
jgi:hypothetical protein